MFTDIVGSSKLWKLNEKRMGAAIKAYEKVVREIISEYGGIVVKTIGDAFMVLFKGSDGYVDALACAMDIQLELNENRVEVAPKKWIKLRIGMCQGPFEEHNVVFQKHRLKDYYGQTVNIASRMESKVADTNDIALAFNEKHSDTSLFKTVSELTKENGSTWEIIIENFSNSCTPTKQIKCFPEEKLHGVGKVKAYLMKLK